ncbi:hypothetical protein D0868_00527 [Hortaea werneckii]|uniref:Uncharacterized protein n=1 Tax=Hortaea werneckii TaxID=91943 RepID=A0A3M6ZLC1_HORWE|nr:hypothetical protein D0868_00527 [Hortaea werneckii]
MPRGAMIVPISLFGANRQILIRGLIYAADPLYAASALAANSFARSSFAAAFPYVHPTHGSMPTFANESAVSLFGVQMYNSRF